MNFVQRQYGFEDADLKTKYNMILHHFKLILIVYTPVIQLYYETVNMVYRGP